ncbi:MAG: hypothetical protein ACK5Y2_05795 [Bdellovibrionales bacterium]
MNSLIMAFAAVFIAQFSFAADPCDSKVELRFRESFAKRPANYHVQRVTLEEAKEIILLSEELWSDDLKQEAIQIISEPGVLVYNLVWETLEGHQPWTLLGFLHTVDPKTCQRLEGVQHLHEQERD